MTAFTGVFPCHKNQFKAGATGTTNAISDMAQGILMLRDCIQTAGALPDENSPKPQK